jgi:2-C-methyl-D-erythritol 4-phosphate cytidylyltransferase/2-C-methyl-D-erythritol 2,4-cyclodiphosphate synthase
MASFGAVVVAAGSSTRMGGIDKVWVEIAGQPILLYSLLAFYDVASQLTLVVRRSDIDRARALLAQHPPPIPYTVVSGGERRQDSVRQGLHATTGVETIAIHDGARPLVTTELIQRVWEASCETGAAIPALPVADTLKRVIKGRTAGIVDRTNLWAVQTPQVFERELLVRAHDAGEKAAITVTDDAALVERIGGEVRVVAGDPWNIKVTTVEDLQRVSVLLQLRQANSSEIRIGSGFDIHRLVKGRPLVIGGVEIPFHLGLVGHSDADVLLHAIMDALLGAVALGDIGQYFPPSDEQWRNASSLNLLNRVASLLANSGFTVVNVDSTVVAEAPHLAPYIAEMRARIATCLGVDISRISVKATTSEGLGSEGRGEGISAYAVAMVAPAKRYG